MPDSFDKRLLKEHIKKRIFTTGIGAIEDIEEIFKDYVTQDEELWKKLRKSILDRINYQFSLVSEDLKKFEVSANNSVTLIGIIKENKNEDRRN